MITATYAFQASAMSISLPLWKEEAEKRGYELPKAFGIGISKISMQQDIIVDSIAIQGLIIPGVKMQAETLAQKNHVQTIRADLWLLPFFNVYAVAGLLESHSKTSITASLGPIHITYPNLRLDLDGHTASLGIILAGGYGNWFTMVDANATKIMLSAVDGNISSFIMTPRIGYDFTKHGYPIRVWSGAMFQYVEQAFSGNVANLGLPDGLAALAPNGRFEVKQRLQTPGIPLLVFMLPSMTIGMSLVSLGLVNVEAL